MVVGSPSVGVVGANAVCAAARTNRRDTSAHLSGIGTCGSDPFINIGEAAWSGQPGGQWDWRARATAASWELTPSLTRIERIWLRTVARVT